MTLFFQACGIAASCEIRLRIAPGPQSSAGFSPVRCIVVIEAWIYGQYMTGPLKSSFPPCRLESTIHRIGPRRRGNQPVAPHNPARVSHVAGPGALSVGHRVPRTQRPQIDEIPPPGRGISEGQGRASPRFT